MRPPELADVPPGPAPRSTASTSAPVWRAATTADAPAAPRPTTTTSTVSSKRTSLTSSAGIGSIPLLASGRNGGPHDRAATSLTCTPEGDDDDHGEDGHARSRSRINTPSPVP